MDRQKFIGPHHPSGDDQGIASSLGADMGPRSSPTVLPTAMSATCSMQTSSVAPAHVDPPTGGDAHEDALEASTADNIPSFLGSSRIASTGTLQATLVHDNRGTKPIHEGLDVHPSSGEHVVDGDQVEHDPGRQHQERDVPQSEDLEGAQLVEVEARKNDVAPLEDPPLVHTAFSRA
ncbi:hypothetical protein SUGI_1192690 [Cryptomeria japonica]|nr:hypothetical protein SUGI_1192690 [Cryptomeria japonica]